MRRRAATAVSPSNQEQGRRNEIDQIVHRLILLDIRGRNQYYSPIQWFQLENRLVHLGLRLFFLHYPNSDTMIVPYLQQTACIPQTCIPCTLFCCGHVNSSKWTVIFYRLTSQWRHNERYGVSNYQRLDCLLNRLYRRRSKKAAELRVTSLCGFPLQRASDAEKVSIWWHHHELALWYSYDCSNASGVILKGVSKINTKPRQSTIEGEPRGKLLGTT